MRTASASFLKQAQPFELNYGGLHHYLCLSFAHYREDDIGEGIRRLASLINEPEKL